MIASNTIVGGRYRVIKPLGGGGMKLVYLAEDLRLAARPCALAEMVDSFTSPDLQRSAIDAFQREADMLAQLNNEHIPRVFDRFSEQNRHYLVMEYIAGVTLEAELKAGGGKLPVARVSAIALQVLDTLEYLHNLNPPVIYRDLKPSNIMLTPDGQAKLIDFGIARFFRPQSNATMIGTQGYAPPEQYRGRVELRSDLYALAATMHHALSGRDPAAEPPFSFPPLRSLVPDAAPALADLVDQSLNYEVILRPADTREFKTRLLAIKNGAAGRAPAAISVTAPKRSSGAPQMQLPLEAPAAAPVSPEAKTAIVAGEIACPGCGRQIPRDSRFCSYCAADLRQVVLGPAAVAAHEASTGPLAAPERSQSGRFRRRPRRYRVAWLIGTAVIIYILGFRVLPAVFAYFSSGPPATPRAYAPRYNPAPAPAAPVPMTPRAVALRDALNAAGYQQVYFRFEGDTLVLWGTVPSETDRIMVQTIAFTAADVVSIDDQIRLERGGPYGSP